MNSIQKKKENSLFCRQPVKSAYAHVFDSSKGHSFIPLIEETNKLQKY